MTCFALPGQSGPGWSAKHFPTVKHLNVDRLRTQSEVPLVKKLAIGTEANLAAPDRDVAYSSRIDLS